MRVEIFDQPYNLRGSDAEYILKLAEYVDGKMRAVSEQTHTVDTARLAVLAALNIADEYHLVKRRPTWDRPTTCAARSISRTRWMKCWKINGAPGKDSRQTHQPPGTAERRGRFRTCPFVPLVVDSFIPENQPPY